MGSCKEGWSSAEDKKRFDRRVNYNGHLVYCISKHLKTFDFNKVYEIEKLTSYDIAIKGFKRTYDAYHFDFLENNEALYRQYQMNSVLDIDELKSDTPKRKIDRVENKSKLLVKFLVNKLNTNVNSGVSVDLENLISEAVSTNKAKYEVTTEDFKFIENLSFKEILNTLK